jgi:hypothetical protein
MNRQRLEFRHTIAGSHPHDLDGITDEFDEALLAYEVSGNQ